MTFSFPAEMAENEVALAGDFNDWDTTSLKMERKNGSYQTTVRLKPETNYKFKYLVDGSRWENDHNADAYEPNEFGTDDSVLSIGK